MIVAEIAKQKSKEAEKVKKLGKTKANTEKEAAPKTAEAANRGKPLVTLVRKTRPNEVPVASQSFISQYVPASEVLSSCPFAKDFGEPPFGDIRKTINYIWELLIDEEGADSYPADVDEFSTALACTPGVTTAVLGDRL